MKKLLSYSTSIFTGLALVFGGGATLVVAVASLNAYSEKNYISADSQNESILLSDNDETRQQTITKTFNITNVGTEDFVEAGSMKIFNNSETDKEIFVHFRADTQEDELPAKNFSINVYKTALTYTNEEGYEITQNFEAEPPILKSRLDKIGSSVFDVIHSQEEATYSFFVVLDKEFLPDEKSDVSFAFEIEASDIEQASTPVLDVSYAVWTDSESFDGSFQNQPESYIFQSFTPHVSGQLAKIQFCVSNSVTVEIYENEVNNVDIQSGTASLIATSVGGQMIDIPCGYNGNDRVWEFAFDESAILKAVKDLDGNYTKRYTARFIPDEDYYRTYITVNETFPDSAYPEGQYSTWNSWVNVFDALMNTWMIEK